MNGRRRNVVRTARMLCHEARRRRVSRLALNWIASRLPRVVHFFQKLPPKYALYGANLLLFLFLVLIVLLPRVRKPGLRYNGHISFQRVGAVPGYQRTAVQRLEVLQQYRAGLANVGLQEGRPLLSKFLLMDLNLPLLNVSHLILHGKPTKMERIHLNITGERMAELRTYIPDFDFHNRYQTCAVVGTSPKLLAHQDGHAIDANDIVLRFHDNPIKGFELYVGRRCTFRVVTRRWIHVLIGKIARDPLRSSPRHSAGGGKTILVLSDSSAKLFIELCKTLPQNTVYYISPEFSLGVRDMISKIKERWEMVDGRGAWESQKTVSPVLESVLFLMQICKSVHIYGFDHPEPYSSRGSKMQSYFDKVSDAGRYDIDSSQVLPFILRIFNIEGLVHFH